MKKFYLLLLAAFFTSTTVDAQLVEDNFDGYTLGDMNDQNPDVWGVWSNTNNGPESIGVSDAYAFSGTQSGFIGAGPGPQDAMLRLGNIEDTGRYELSFQMYIPAGKTGYFNIQGETEDNGGANNGMGTFNSSNLVFNNTQSANGASGLGGSYPNIADADPAFSWDYPEDTWFPVHILFVISDDDDSTGWTLTVNDIALEKQEFAEEDVIGGIDFFGIDANNEYYIDDVLFEDTTPVIMINTDNPVLNAVKAYPNPVTEQLTIESSEAIDEITVYNLLGSPVLNATPNVLSPSVDMSSFSSGLYLVELRIGDARRTIKVTK